MIVSIIISAFLLSLILSNYCQKLFIKKQIFDKINIRSSHNTLATRSGGLNVYITLAIISVLFYFNQIQIYDYSLMIPLSIIFFVGVYDDIYNVDFKLKFIFQIIVAKIIIDNGFIVDNFHGIFGIFEINRIIAQLVTIFIIVSIINAINLIDGIDGLTISISLIFIVFYEFFSFNKSDFNLLSVLLISSLIPMYYFNFRKKNKIFLGDSGSYLLGGIISIYVMNILSNEFRIKPEFDINKILFVVSILIYPIIDVARVFFIRLKNKKSTFEADKNHIHHIILNKVNSHIKTTLLISCFTIFMIILTQLIF